MRESPLSSRRMCGMASSPIGSTRLRSKRPIRARLLEERRIKMLEKTGVLPSLSDLFKMTHATSDGVFVDPASRNSLKQVATRIEERETQLTQESPDGLPVTLSTEEADRIFEEVLAPRKKGRIVGIGSVNQVARATSSYTSRRDEETSQMKARMDSQQVRLDSLEDLLDVMAVGNPVMRENVESRRAALGLPVRDPQESDPTLFYIEDFTWSLHRNVTWSLHRNIYEGVTTKMFTCALHRIHYVEFTTKFYVSLLTNLSPC
ncbi:unnamed protein product, partial [Brassica rapa]